jgi:DnaJ family protein C protein 28
MDDFGKQLAKNAAEQARHKQRMREDWDGLIEDIIQEGVDKGLFDNLKGKGKPLNLSNNHFDSGQTLANSIMKDNDVSPSWIEDRNRILAERDELREEMKRKWAWHSQKFEEGTAVEKDRLTISWDDFCKKWQVQIEALNKFINTYNLKRPSEKLEIFKLSLEDELKRAGAPRWLR